MPEILASINDINAHLPQDLIVADDVNSGSMQLSVARIVRGNLSSLLDRVTLASWTTPDNTPDEVREAAALLIAAQLYLNAVAKAEIDIPDTNYGQRLYNQAIAILNSINSGAIVLDLTGSPNAVVGSSLTRDDFFPVDSKDRAFTMGQNF